jgi:shikimate dehydrogenase
VEGFFEKINLKSSDLKGFFNSNPDFDFITVTMPHKREVIPYLDEQSEDAVAIGAVNFITNIDQKLVGYNFDGMGALDPIEEKISVKGKKVVVLGAGGSARAAIYEAKKRGARVKIVNRTEEKGIKLAKEFDVEFNRFIPSYFDVLINATSVGMDPQDKTKLIEKDHILNGVVVLDMASREGQSILKDQTEKNGGIYIFGKEMFLSLTNFGFKEFLFLYKLHKIKQL